MYYIYLLHCLKDNGYYIGYTDNPSRRLLDHQNGNVDATRYRRPVEMIYTEGYTLQQLALEREKKLKDFGSAYMGLLKRLGLK